MNVMETIYKNVKALAAINGIKLMDVQKDVGLPVGYLSRCKGLHVDVLVKIARMLNVSMDDLIYCDFAGELAKKEAMCNLRAAVVRAKKYYSEDGIVTFVENAYRDPEEVPDE